MTDQNKLTDLRNQIDAVDTEMLALLKKRASIVGEVAKTKGAQDIYIRPGREAKMLRILLEEAGSDIPKGLVHRLWREMIGAFTLQEGSFKVGVTVPRTEEGFWDLARDHFGSFTPLQSFASGADAMRALLAREIMVAAFPFPAAGGEGWWRGLLDDTSGHPKVFYSFPFDGLTGNARTSQGKGLVVGYVEPEETGRDVTLLAVEWKGAPPSNLAALQSLAPEKSGGGASLLHFPGFLTVESPALKNWLEQNKNLILRHRIIGAYPVPFSG